MNLLCLSCGGSFDIDDALAASSATSFKCASCGAVQPLYLPEGRGAGNLGLQEEPSEQVLIVADQAAASCDVGKPGGSAIPKPLSLRWAGRRQQTPAAGDSAPDSVESPESVADSVSGSATIPEMPEVPEIPELPEVSTASSSTMKLNAAEWADSVPDIAVDAGGPYTVTSPAALVFEFPDFGILEEWARSAGTPEKYSVCDAAGVTMPMNEFIRNRKVSTGRGSGMISAMRVQDEIRDSLTAGRNPDELVATGKSRKKAGDPGNVMSARQFQFKIAEEEPRDWSKIILPIVLFVIVAATGVAAAYVFGLL